MIKIASSKQDLEKIFQLRYEVLRKPWGQTLESAKDELDGISLNAFIEENNMCIACGRLDFIDKETGQIRYMAVHPDYRNNQLGKKIFLFLEERAREKGLKKIFLHARENALSFYLSNGCQLVGHSYVLFNAIQHYLMEKEI
ncbi:MAG: GNAT family N-acetyltransferase [Bacteroidia bacterium]|nr:GNAT family N-acetyltransferase [Bacteroidia bacterium]